MKLTIEQAEVEANELQMQKFRKEPFAQGWFTICPLHSLDRMFGDAGYRRARETREWGVLMKLHCVNFSQMSEDLRDSLPSMVESVIHAARTPIVSNVIDLNTKRSWWRFGRAA